MLAWGPGSAARGLGRVTRLGVVVCGLASAGPRPATADAAPAALTGTVVYSDSQWGLLFVN
jgi:hypothetical protein